MAVALLAAVSLGKIAIERGEPVNSIWLVLAAACTYAIGYRFYAKFIAARVMALDTPGHARRAAAQRPRFRTHQQMDRLRPPLRRHRRARDRWSGPTLAAQFGYLPGTLWIIIGAVLGGAVQDFVILFCSMRRDGKSLGQMAREEIGKVGGFTALSTVLLIMIILLAVVALVVVNALKDSPWGTFTIAATMPIAVFMGLYLRYCGPGKVLEARRSASCWCWSSIFGGQWVSHSPTLAPMFTFTGVTLAFSIIVYGFLASALPVWLLLAPRDYLSTFVKLGVVLMLGCRHSVRAAGAATAGVHPIRRRHGPDLRRQDLSVLLHHHRLRSDLRLSRADLLRHDAEDDRPRVARLAGRLWLDAAGKLRRDHGADCRLRAAARRLLRGQLAGRRRRRNARGGRRDDHAAGAFR